MKGENQHVEKRLKIFQRVKGLGYSPKAVQMQREWLSQHTGVSLKHIGMFSEDPQNMKGNIENLIGAVQIPVGISGPMKVNGQFAKGVFYVPMATTEGALVYTYTQGMQILSLAGGVSTAVLRDELHISSTFGFRTGFEARKFRAWVEANFQQIKKQADKTTEHGKLIRIEPLIFDRNVILKFYYTTGDAAGLNMSTFATDAACKFISSITKPRRFFLQANYSGNKKVTFHNFITGYGKTVVADCIIQRKLFKRCFSIFPEVVIDYYKAVSLNAIHAGMIGINGHTANGLTAIFMACGQDVASVVESHVSVVNFELTEKGDLYISIKLPSLIVGTVGGGVSLATQKESLEMIGCYGSGKAKKLSEIIAASALAGELVIVARVASGEFVNAHRKYGRNVKKRPVN